MTKTFEVTQTDIDHGVRGIPDRCPVALAMKRTLGTDVLVGSNGISIKTCPIVLEHPAIVQDFINNFDDSNPVRPISFEMVIPENE